MGCIACSVIVSEIDAALGNKDNEVKVSIRSKMNMIMSSLKLIIIIFKHLIYILLPFCLNFKNKIVGFADKLCKCLPGSIGTEVHGINFAFDPCAVVNLQYVHVTEFVSSLLIVSKLRKSVRTTNLTSFATIFTSQSSLCVLHQSLPEICTQ